MQFYFTDKNRLFRGSISVHTLSLILGCCTFGSGDSFKTFWERSYKLCTLVSGHFCPFLLAYPCKLSQVGWGASVHNHFQLFPQMVNWIQVWALGHSRTCTDFVLLAVCLRSLSCWEVNFSHSLRSRALWSRLSSRPWCTWLHSSSPLSGLVAPFPLLKNIPTS